MYGCVQDIFVKLQNWCQISANSTISKMLVPWIGVFHINLSCYIVFSKWLDVQLRLFVLEFCSGSFGLGYSESYSILLSVFTNSLCIFIFWASCNFFISDHNPQIWELLDWRDLNAAPEAFKKYTRIFTWSALSSTGCIYETRSKSTCRSSFHPSKSLLSLS